MQSQTAMTLWQPFYESTAPRFRVRQTETGAPPPLNLTGVAILVFLA
jgi:hypothetical protein